MDNFHLRHLKLQKESLVLSKNNIEHDINHCHDKIALLAIQKKKVIQHIEDVNNEIKKAVNNG